LCFEEELLALANGLATGPKAVWRLLYCGECLSLLGLLGLELSWGLLASMWGCQGKQSNLLFGFMIAFLWESQGVILSACVWHYSPLQL